MTPLRRAPLAAAILLALPGLVPAAGAQEARVAVPEENFRSEPGGSILAELLEGTLLSLGEARGQWREATLEAWIWTRSVREQQREDLRLLVNAGGENLRAGPNGRKLGRARGGMRLDGLEREGDWTRVRRTGWIWRPSIERVAVEDTPVGDPAPGPGAPASASTREFVRAPGSTLILDAPAGDTVARIQPGGSVEVLAREGDWTRVRIEGWTFTGSLAESDSGASGILEDIGRDSLQAHPDRFRGRRVAWSLQFIALQEAERFRTEFLEGEPFMLARGPGDDPGFVYVAVPPDLLDAVKRLAPLRRIRVVGRVRAVQSTLTGAPVLDLIDVRPL